MISSLQPSINGRDTLPPYLARPHRLPPTPIAPLPDSAALVNCLVLLSVLLGSRLETNKLRNVAKFFAHLLYTDALPWTCLESIRLSEDATTSSSRIFIKILVLVRCDAMQCDIFRSMPLTSSLKESGRQPSALG